MGTANGIAFETLAVSNTAVRLSEALWGIKGVNSIVVTVEGAEIRVRIDPGEATADEGHLLEAGDVYRYNGKLKNVSMIRAGDDDATVQVTYGSDLTGR